ncbi:hypothetical protein ACWHAM_07885 [Paenibacillus terrae]|uniref:Phosphotransferase enzyme family protein n=1 Tax=Paenibacillus terrae (strain HPL-003) TaxID=985665 RepID=G7W236_PAETH|nr:phosphotransferase enzyme family protein [Paenibacillus terrae HPL-003]
MRGINKGAGQDLHMESVWWIKADMDQHAVPVRFAKEMNWLAENYKDFPDVLGDI